MENLSFELSSAKYDQFVHHPQALPEQGNMKIYAKPLCTKEGRPGVVIAWSVTMPDGSTRVAQATTTFRLLETAVKTLGTLLELEAKGKGMN